MTEAELERIRREYRAELRRRALTNLVTECRKVPGAKEALDRWAKEFRANAARGQPLDGVHPAVADMLWGEYEEAVDEMLRELGL